MAERYIRLHKSEQECFLPGCPISLAAFAVLRDKKEEINLLQLKFKNCSDKTVTGIVLSITTFDQLGKEIETVKGHQYAKLNAGKGAFFGADSTVSLSKKTPVSDIALTLELVLLSDGSNWENEERRILEACPPPQDLLGVFPEDLTEEYRRVTNQHMKYVPEDFNGTWRCSCGSLNSGECCVVCETLKKDVFEKCTLEFLLGSYTERIYSKANRLKTSSSIDSLSKAVKLLETIPDYKDSRKIISECNEAIKERTEYERRLNEERAKAEEKQRKTSKLKKCLIGVTLIAVSLLLVVLITTSMHKETRIERCEKVLKSSNSSEEEKRIELAYITNQIINERIRYENSYEGEEDEAYYEKIVSIEKPLASIIAECDLSTFITDYQVEQAFESYSSAIYDLSDAVGDHNEKIEDILDIRDMAIVPLYRGGYLDIPADDYIKCCEAYIANQLSEKLTGTVTYTKDPDASTWSLSTSLRNTTLAKLHNCELKITFFVGANDYEYEYVIDNWRPDAVEDITYHVDDNIVNAAKISGIYFETEIEGLIMRDNDYMGDY